MEIWDSRCQSVADRAGFSSSFVHWPSFCPGRSALHLSRYALPARASLCGGVWGGYATSDLLLLILTCWNFARNTGGAPSAGFLILFFFFFTCVCLTGPFPAAIGDECMHESILDACVRSKMYVLAALLHAAPLQNPFLCIWKPFVGDQPFTASVFPACLRRPLSRASPAQSAFTHSLLWNV